MLCRDGCGPRNPGLGFAQTFSKSLQWVRVADEPGLDAVRPAAVKRQVRVYGGTVGERVHQVVIVLDLEAFQCKTSLARTRVDIYAFVGNLNDPERILTACRAVRPCRLVGTRHR